MHCRQLFRTTWTLLVTACLLAVAGCAHVAFEPGKKLEQSALVFGRILLDRDGEKLVVSPFSMPVVIRDIETGAEPRVLVQNFEKDGTFYWAMPPGRYQLSVLIHNYSDGIQSYSFNLEKAGNAYYFGDLTIHGRRRFDHVGSANMREIQAVFDDRFDEAQTELVQRNPSMRSSAMQRLTVHDMTKPVERVRVYQDAMAAQRVCCDSLASVHYKPLAVGASVAEKIDKDSRVFGFEEGRSRFLAWELPSLDKPFIVNMRSVVTPSGLPGTGGFYIFSPAIMLLDSAFQMIGKQESGLFIPVPTSVFPMRSASLMAQIDSRRLPPNAKYLMVYTTPTIIEGVLSTTAPGFMPIAGGVLPTGFPVMVHMEPAISGDFEVELLPR